MGGGMMGGGGGDMAEFQRVLEDPNDPGSAAARQALGAAKAQGLSPGQSLVAAAEAYERATGKPMPGAPSGADLQTAKQFQNGQAADQKASQDRVAEQKTSQAQESKAKEDGATMVTLYWECATKCDRLNSQPAPSLSGEAHIMTTLSTGAASKQTTRVVESSASPCWKEHMEWKIADFDNVNPKLSLSLKQGTKKDVMFTHYNLVDLKKVKKYSASGFSNNACQTWAPGAEYWLKVGEDLSVESSSSQLAQKADLRVCLTFS